MSFPDYYTCFPIAPILGSNNYMVVNGILSILSIIMEKFFIFLLLYTALKSKIRGKGETYVIKLKYCWLKSFPLSFPYLKNGGNFYI